MSEPEIKVGQKYRVVDPVSFGYSGILEGEVLTVQSFEEPCYWYLREHVFMFPEEVTQGVLELVEDAQEPTEASEDVSGLPCDYTSEESENVSQASTGGFTSMTKGCAGELLWKFIEGSNEYNSHYQMEIAELSFESLKDVVREIGTYLEAQGYAPDSDLEIRLMYNGDFGGKYSGTWSASVYQLDYWSSDEHPSGHRDRLLFSVEIVKGI
tara:strand:+ start:73263 stop:73895 length:633 start_codon:yes stop_codon:yes gene_type:complete